MTIITELSDKMHAVLNKVAEAAAEKKELIKRKGKITGANLCQTLVLGWWQNPDATLEELTQVGKSVGLQISPQGLNQRWNQTTASFLQQILTELVSMKIAGETVELPSMNQFSHVYVEDSSMVSNTYQAKGESKLSHW